MNRTVLACAKDPVQTQIIIIEQQKKSHLKT